MKKYFIILLTITNSIAFGQSKTVHRSIEEDGNAVSIHISGTIAGQTVSFDRTFDLSFLDKTERAALKEKVLGSLDFSLPPTPESPQAPLFSSEEPGKIIPKTTMDNNAEKREKVDSEICDNKHPFSKEIKYDSEGEMYLHYQFVKDGEDFEYERTLNAKGKSERERQQIIKETEQEIGFSINK